MAAQKQVTINPDNITISIDYGEDDEGIHIAFTDSFPIISLCGKDVTWEKEIFSYVKDDDVCPVCFLLHNALD